MCIFSLLAPLLVDRICINEFKFLGERIYPSFHMSNLDLTLPARPDCDSDHPVNCPWVRDRLSQSYGFSSSHVWMWELDHKEGWVLKNWCFQIVVLEKTLESPLDWEEIKPVSPIGDQSWMFIGRTDAEPGAPTLWPPDAKNWLIVKDPDAGKDWRQKGMAEDEMVR